MSDKLFDLNKPGDRFLYAMETQDVPQDDLIEVMGHVATQKVGVAFIGHEFEMGVTTARDLAAMLLQVADKVEGKT